MVGLKFCEDAPEILHERLPSASLVIANERRSVHLTQSLKVKRVLPFILEVAIRIQIHFHQPTVGKAEINSLLGWYATELRDRQAVPNAHIRYRTARKAHPGLCRVLVAVTRVTCRERYDRRPRVRVKTEGGDLGVVRMRCNDQYAILGRDLLAAKMHAGLFLAHR